MTLVMANSCQELWVQDIEINRIEGPKNKIDCEFNVPLILTFSSEDGMTLHRW